MRSLCFISFYSGPFPDYFRFFLDSCQRNPDVRFIIFNDTLEADRTLSNVELKKLSRAEFESLVAEKLGFAVRITRGLKIAEFRPAFGLLFDDLLRGCDFWGYCDVDQIFGDIRKFMTQELLDRYDVITTTHRWVAGHFALFRNTAELLRLFARSPNFREVFQDSDRNWHFEESCLRWDGVERSVEDLAARNEPVSIYDLVQAAQKAGQLRALFGAGVIREHSATSVIDYERNGRTLVDRRTGEELLYHHLVTVKNFWWFYLPPWRRIPDDYHITARGMKTAADLRFPGCLAWHTRWLMNMASGIARSVRRKLG